MEHTGSGADSTRERRPRDTSRSRLRLHWGQYPLWASRRRPLHPCHQQGSSGVRNFLGYCSDPCDCAASGDIDTKKNPSFSNRRFRRVGTEANFLKKKPSFSNRLVVPSKGGVSQIDVCLIISEANFPIGGTLSKKFRAPAARSYITYPI